MTIETKMNIGDTVYFLYNHKIVSSNIGGIAIRIDKHEQYTTSYFVNTHTSDGGKWLTYVYSSRDELISKL